MAPRASRASPRASRRFPPSRRLGSLALVAFVLVVALPRVPPALAQLSADDADPVAPGADDAAGDGGGGADGGAAGDGGGAPSDGGASGGSDGPLPAGGADVVGGVGLGLSYATGTTFDDLAEDVAEKFKTIAGIADAQGGNATDADAILEYIAEGGENPYSFLYGVDENAAEVNKRLLCRRGCLDPLVDVNLVWCAGAVTYSYCNRVVADDPQAAVLDMEEGAIAAYMRLVRVVPTPDAPECKPILRAWMCYEFFNRCNTDGTEFYPVCHTTCAAAKYACGNPAWIECDQEVEELENSAPDEWFVDGDRSQPYIRGLKPDGSLGSPVFETDQLRCTGGGGGRFGGTEFAFAFAAAALAATWRERALPPRPNAAYRESAS